jgi:hypothetical protein
MATPRYRMSSKIFIRADHTAEAWIYEAGAEIEFSGRPSRNFIPLNVEAERKMAFAPLTLNSQNVLPRRGDAP